MDPRRATYADLDRTPEGDGKAYELIDGTLYVSPRPTARHSVAQVELVRVLDRAFAAEGHDAADAWTFVSDLAAWRGPLPPVDARGDFHTPPPWVCAVLSPSNLRLDWSRKLPAHFRHGVQWVWLVDPRVEELHVLEATGPGERFEGSPAAEVRPPPLGVPLDLGRFWTRLPAARPV